MVNTTGRNGYNNGTRPSDEKLHQLLLECSQEQSTELEMRMRLEAIGYKIGKTKLYALLKDFNIPSPRKTIRNMPEEAVTTLILDRLDQDPFKQKGPNAIRSQLARDHQPVPRDKIRAVQKIYQPEGSLIRRPGNRSAVPRMNLLILGPFQEMHADGMEKFSASAIRMGPVGIPVYGFRQHVGYIQKMNVVPNARKADAVGHLHLDMIEEAGYYAPVQMTVDKGSETGEMFAQQCAIRKQCSTLDLELIPPFWTTKSIHNIPIESSWHWMAKYNGHSIRAIIEEGKTNGLFNPTNPVHCDLFHWLFPKIVQSCLDDYRDWWNKHRIRRQKNSPLPSGVTPNQIMSCPESYGMVDSRIRVDPTIITALRSRLPPKEEVFRWVSDEFDTMAWAAYDQIGRPSLKASALVDSWSIYGRMLLTILDMIPRN